MIGKGFYDYEELEDEEYNSSQLKGLSLDKLNLKEVNLYTDSLTVRDALKELEKGIPGLPVVVAGKIYSTVYPEKLIKAI